MGLGALEVTWIGTIRDYMRRHQEKRAEYDE